MLTFIDGTRANLVLAILLRPELSLKMRPLTLWDVHVISYITQLIKD